MHVSANTPSKTPSRDTPGVCVARRLLSRTAGRAAVAAVAVVAAVAGVGWMSVASAAGSTVSVATNATLGTILTDAQGFALYTFSMDHNGMSSCTGSCAAVWPALTVPAGTTPTAGTGVTGTVAAVLQANGTYQVTYNGSPLYTFVSDTAPGQVTGNGVGGFSIVKVAATAPAPAMTPTTAAPAPAATPATAAPTPTSAGGKPATTAPATTPAYSSSSPPAAASAPGSSTPVQAGAPTALALTGPGPALLWLAVGGAGLVALSLLLLAASDRMRTRTALWSAARTRRS